MIAAAATGSPTHQGEQHTADRRRAIQGCRMAAGTWFCSAF
jgi:hypothetical protein